jgi:hypothetical protein
MMRISKLRLAFLIAAVAGGAWLGSMARAAASSGGLGFVNGVVAMALAGLILIVLALFAVVSARQRDGAGGPAARATVLAGFVFAASFGGGWAVVALVRGPDPVQLEAAGMVDLTIDGLPGYTRNAGASSTCRSPFGFETVQEVTAGAAGSIGADPMYISLTMIPEQYPGIEPGIVVSMQPALGEFAPQWTGGTSELVAGVIGGTSGRVTFSRLTLEGNASGGAPPGWPLEVSGELAWSCQDWAG